MSDIVGEFFSSFELEACRFPAPKIIIRIGWLGFVSGDFARLAPEVCNAWERILVQQERRCQG